MSSPINPSQHAVHGESPIESTKHISRQLSELSETVASINNGQTIAENTTNVSMRLTNKELNLQGRVTLGPKSKESTIAQKIFSGAYVEKVAKHLPRGTSAIFTPSA